MSALEAADPPTSEPGVVAVGGCYAWPLPLEATCAGEARHAFRQAAHTLGLPDDLVYDGMTMASELAANTMHAQDNVEFDGVAQWPVAGGPEVWMYLRRFGNRWELVCKIFDSMTGWRGGSAPDPGDPGPDAVCGRGLRVVAALSAGRWGYHLTRSRLGGWKVPGKAVWFAVDVPAAHVPPPLRQARMNPSHAARALEALLAERGLGARLLRIDERGAGMSVLSVRYGLTLWCHAGMIWWRTRSGYERQLLTDLEEVAEQVVCICEEMDRGRSGGYPEHDRLR